MIISQSAINISPGQVSHILLTDDQGGLDRLTDADVNVADDAGRAWDVHLLTPTDNGTRRGARITARARARMGTIPFDLPTPGTVTITLPPDPSGVSAPQAAMIIEYVSDDLH